MIFKCKARQLFKKTKLIARIYITILLIVFFTEGCTIQVRYPAEFPSKTIITSEENFWFWGLIGEKHFEVYNLCPGGRIYEIIIDSTLLQSTLTVLSFGIYSPRTTTIVCSIRGE